MDAFKLISIQRAVSDPQNLKCYLIIPEEIEQQLHGSDWFSWALSQAADIFPVKLTDDQRQRLMEATSLQALGQTRIKKIKGEILHG